MKYCKRLIEKTLTDSLNTSGTVFIRGVKASGKTETALRYAKSSINLQENERIRTLATISPQDILIGATPRLIDEWQEVPSIWNNVKIETDKRKDKNQFILTGSSTLKNKDKIHTGAGRIITLDMSTLTWEELGYSNSSVGLSNLLNGALIKPKQNEVKLKTICKRLVIGGWPSLIGKDERQASILNRSYVDLLLSDDISRVSGVQRNRNKATRVMQSLARNIATCVDISTVSSDADISRPATYEYLEDLRRIMILIDQPSWNVHIRSAASLRTTPKRHIVDTSLSCAILGLSSSSLFQDLNYTGFLFESLVFHDLTVYAQQNDAHLSYYRDSSGNEIDIIAEKRDGSWAAFEVKLGDHNLDQAASKLSSFTRNIDTKKSKSPSSLNIITGTGLAYTREDGINVLPISVLGP